MPREGSLNVEYHNWARRLGLAILDGDETSSPWLHFGEVARFEMSPLLIRTIINHFIARDEQRERDEAVAAAKAEFARLVMVNADPGLRQVCEAKIAAYLSPENFGERK